MFSFPESIVYFWLLPVTIQILLPLAMFAFHLVNSGVKVVLGKEQAPIGAQAAKEIA